MSSKWIPNDTVVGGVSSGGGGRVTLTPADAEADSPNECTAVRWVAPSVDCRVPGHLWQPQLESRPHPWHDAGFSHDSQMGLSPRATSSRMTMSVTWPPSVWLAKPSSSQLFNDESLLGKEIRLEECRHESGRRPQPQGPKHDGTRPGRFYHYAPWTTVKFRVTGRPGNPPRRVALLQRRPARSILSTNCTRTNRCSFIPSNLPFKPLTPPR